MPPLRKRATRIAALLAVPLALTAVQLGSSASAATSASAPTNFAYRHGVVPRLDANFHARTSATRAVTTNMYYHGGTNGIGVVTGPPKVYIVYWGSQWGTATTNGSGDTTFSGDSAGLAPYQQKFFKGLGTGGELWSGVMTQYCQGIANGSSDCSGSTQHVGYPTGGALAGVWYDNSAAAPASATGHDLAQEAINAAAHFGNTTAASQRNVQYVITSPTGTNPDGYQSPTSGYCAYHDYTGDPTMSGGGITSPYGDLAWTNMPYIVDVGSTCGAGFVNPGNNLDGVSIVGGHEFAETVTDQFPYQTDPNATDIISGGWDAGAGNRENGDLCAWKSSGTAASRNLNLTTGTFAVQTTWGNDTTSCEFSHAIVGNGSGNTVTVGSQPAQSWQVGTAASLQMSATDSASGQTLTWSATGLPAGLSINASTGLISGAPSTAASGSATVTATDTTGAHGSASVSWTVAGSGGGNPIVNGGFENGSLSGWTTSGAASVTTSGVHSGGYAAMVGSTNPSSTSSISQSFQAASGNTTLSFWYDNVCPDTVTYDWATATLKDTTTNTTKTVLAKTCSNPSSGWKQITASITAGHSYTLTLASHDDNYPGDPTYTLYDDVIAS